MPTVDFNDRTPALNYIRERGYASYSSMKNVRDALVPQIINAKYFTFGKELHSRFLEGIKLETLPAGEETLLKNMVKSLKGDKVVQEIMKASKREVEFRETVMGVKTLGYIDILKPEYSADLKTTRLTNMKQFVSSMDFLQAALYMAATKKRDFIYVGISKCSPYKTMVFSVNSYPAKLHLAQEELFSLLKYLKENL